MSFVGGTAYFKIDGVQYNLVGELNIALGDTEKEPAVGMDGVHGFISMPRAPSIKGKIRDSNIIDTNILEELTDVTITAELINGKTAILRNATQTAQISVDAADGSFDVEFFGLSGEWTVAA